MSLIIYDSHWIIKFYLRKLIDYSCDIGDKISRFLFENVWLSDKKDFFKLDGYTCTVCINLTKYIPQIIRFGFSLITVHVSHYYSTLITVPYSSKILQ